MTTVEIPTQAQQSKHEQPPAGPVVLKGISWAVYEALLADLERSGQHVYLTYDRGTLEIMPPSPFHERYKTALGRLIETLSTELAIPTTGLGSTTFKREDLARGLEPDECYYVQHAPQMEGRFELDLLRDPPPDLAIEMDHTHHAKGRDGIYAALGVPEVWQFDGGRIRAFKRTHDGRYEAIEYSLAFPFLKVTELERFLQLARTTNDFRAAVAFRDWLRETQGPKP
jgi:Uma2 family endonuclease